MAATISFFPVGNGDMTLIQFESGRTLLLDMNIRSAALDDDDETPNVLEQLRERLPDRDAEGRLYVDALLISHPDEDHCRGLAAHFHLGDPDSWSEKTDKILIRELWSSPMAFRRAEARNEKEDLTFCEDADAFATEVIRRIRVFRKSGEQASAEGNRVLILGKDENGKSEGLERILVSVGDTFSKIDGEHDTSFEAVLLAPLPKQEDEAEEAKLEKNDSSTILQFRIAGGGEPGKCLFLTGGDAGVGVWEKIHAEYFASRPEVLEYHILQAPHHCSWRSLSWDSWSEMRQSAVVSETAREALSKCSKAAAVVVASSNVVEDNDVDPPCIRARQEYEDILETNTDSGSFECVAEQGARKEPKVLEFEIGPHGPAKKLAPVAPTVVTDSTSVSRQPRGHG